MLSPPLSIIPYRILSCSQWVWALPTSVLSAYWYQLCYEQCSIAPKTIPKSKCKCNSITHNFLYPRFQCICVVHIHLSYNFLDIFWATKHFSLCYIASVFCFCLRWMGLTQVDNSAWLIDCTCFHGKFSKVFVLQLLVVFNKHIFSWKYFPTFS